MCNVHTQCTVLFRIKMQHAVLLLPLMISAAARFPYMNATVSSDANEPFARYVTCKYYGHEGIIIIFNAVQNSGRLLALVASPTFHAGVV